MRCLRRNATYSAPEKGRRTVTPLTTDEVAQHVPKGVPDDTQYCPVARALTARFRRGRWNLTETRAERLFGVYVMEYPLPDAVREFIRKFDRGEYPKLISTTGAP